MAKITMQKDDKIDFLWDKYILECRLNGYSEDTIRNKEHYFSIFYRFLGAEKRARNLSKDVCVSFLQARLKEGIKEVSINSSTTVINTFLHWLYEYKYISEDLKIPKLKTQEVAKETYTDEDLKVLLEKPDTIYFAEFRTWVIINYILATGNRLSSLLNIRNSDVYLSEGYLNLAHTKNKKKQIVPLSSSLCMILQEYMSIRQGEKEDYLFCSVYGKQLSRKGAGDALDRYCKARKIESLGHHAFRHTFAKISVRDCHVDAFRLQKLMGHSDIKTTEHYVNLYSGDLLNDRDTYNPLEHLLKENNSSTERIAMKKKKR